MTVKIRMLVWSAAFLPVLAMPASADQSLDGSDAVAVPTLYAAITRLPATEQLRGTVDSVDQGNDTIEIRLSPDRKELFKVQDGLIFDMVRFGDPVEISVQIISGARTIVRLTEK